MLISSIQSTAVMISRIICFTDTFSYEKVSYNNLFNFGYPDGKISLADILQMVRLYPPYSTLCDCLDSIIQYHTTI